MCDNHEWRTQYFNKQGQLYGKMVYNGSGNVKINGRVSNYIPSSNTKVVFWAPNPPDYHTSFSGSALPFANENMAFEQTPNAGVIDVDSDGSFSISMQYPSGYYSGLGTLYIAPHVRLQQIVNNVPGPVQVIKIENGMPFRLLTYPPAPSTAPRCSPNFYNNRSYLPVRTQEQILRDSAYPKTKDMPANFWGLRPAN